MGRWLVLLPLLGLLTFGYADKCPKQRTSPGREILCYTATTDVKQLEDALCRCTTLVHQGHDLKDLSTSEIENFQKSLKEMNPTLQILLSVSDEDGSLKTSARVRQEAAARIVRVLNKVDGIELNVTAGTKERLVHFVQGLKTEMVRKSKDKRILLVLPTKPEDLAKQFDLKALSKYVDFFTLPTHYLVDDEEAFRTFHPSRLMGLFDMLNTDSLVDLVSGMGAGKRKILISLPASVYKFALEKNDENAPRAAAKGKLPVQISRSEMCKAMDEGEWIIERDEDLTAPYAFKDETWMAFEDKISAGIKGKYVLLRDLAGLGIHNVEKDSKSKCGNSLTENVYHSFTDNKRKTREAVLTSLQEDLQQPQGPYSAHIKSSEYRIVRVVDTDGHIHAMRENTQTEFSCPRQGYFVHPKSCNRFYRCVKFNQGIDDYSVFEFDCPAGLAFDETTEVCVWPGSISACSGSSEIAPSKDAKFTCPDHPGYYADPKNCRFFYACFDLGEHELTAYEFRCPYGLVFDEHKLICEWPYLVPDCHGETYERHDYDGGEHGGSHQGGHGGYDQDGHGGYDQGGHGGTNEGGHGGYDQGGHGGYGEGGHGGYDQGGHGGYDQGGHGGHDQESHGGAHGGGHGEHDQGGHGVTVPGGHEGHDQGGHEGHDQDGYGGYDQSGHGGHNQEGHGGYDQGGHGGYDQGGHGGHDQGGYGGDDQGGHGGYDQGGHGGAHKGADGEYDRGGHEATGPGGHRVTVPTGHGVKVPTGHGMKVPTGHGRGGHGGYDQGGHGVTIPAGHGGHDQESHGGAHEGGHGEHDQGGHGVTVPGGHGVYDQGGHGGADEGGHGGYDQGGHGVTVPVGHGGYDQGGHGVIASVGHGGYDQGGHGVTVPLGHGGYDQGGHGGANQGGHGVTIPVGHGGYDQGGHEVTVPVGHGGYDQGGHGVIVGVGNGGYDQGRHGVTVPVGHGGYDQGGHGSANQGGHGVTVPSGHGVTVPGGHEGYDQGGHGIMVSGGHGGYDEGGHGVKVPVGHGGYGQGGHEGTNQDGYGVTIPGGHGGAVPGGHGGYDQGGHGITVPGGHGGYDQKGHGITAPGGHGGYDQGGHGVIVPGGHRGYDQGGHGVIVPGGHGGYDQGGHGEADKEGHGVTVSGGHGVIIPGEHGQGGHGGYDQGGHGVTAPGGHGDYGGSSQGSHGTKQGGHEGVNQEGHGGIDQVGHVSVGKGEYGGSSEGGYKGTSQGGYGGSTYTQHGESSENTHTGPYTTQGSYTNIEPKYPVTSSIGYSPAPGVGVFTNAGGYSGGFGTGSTKHQTSTVNRGYPTIDTGVHTGITAGGYDGHTTTIHYGGHTGPGVTYEIEETTSHDDSGASGNAKTTYHGNFGTAGQQGGYGGSGYTDGSSRISAGSTTYHGKFGTSGYTVGGSTGSISSGTATQGVIRTGDSTSGTVYTQGDISGSVISGSSEQGGIITGVTQPGYVQTHSGTPGYVITDGVKTVYDGSASKSTFIQGDYSDGALITGAPAHGGVLSGNSSPGTRLTGQTSPGVILGSAVTPGFTIGQSTRGTYYTQGSSIHNGAAGAGNQATSTKGAQSTYYHNNPFLGHSSPGLTVSGSATSDASYGSTGGGYYTGGSGTSVYNSAAGSRGKTTFASASNGVNFPKTTFTSVTGDSGYKTNEYHDNGGRGTIRYNNGEVTHKFTEDDVRDHRTQFGTYPTFDVGSYEASTASKGSFTKTGPTKTGIVTAQVGGSGTYVAGSTPRPFSSGQNIGPNAFGTTKTSSSASYATSTSAPGIRYTTQQSGYDASGIDVSKINLGSTSAKSSSGYSYTKPAIQLNTFGVTGSTEASVFSGKETSGFSTSAPPFLDVHIYNNPSIVTSAPITASPAVVNTYTYSKPSSDQYGQSVYQSANLPSSLGGASTGVYSRPIVTQQGKFSSVSSTAAPIGFTTGPLENFKSTVFEAARIPPSISTVQPVIDTGYKTVVSPTPFIVGTNTDALGYSHSTGYQSNSLSTKSNSALNINVSFQPDISTQGQYDNDDTVAPAGIETSGYSASKTRRPSGSQSIVTQRPTVQQVTYKSTGSSGYTDSSDYSDYAHTQTGGTFGQRVSQGVSVTPTVKYATPSVVISTKIYNVPSSTPAPAIGVTYREPFQIGQSTVRPTSQSQESFQGYTYSKPSVKFITSTSPSISYNQKNSYDYESTKSGGSPTNLGIPRTEVEKLVTNYDRGNAKYTPSGYETYSDNTATKYDKTLSNTNQYSGKQSYASTKTSSGSYNSRVYTTTPGYDLNTNTGNFGSRSEGSSSSGFANSNLDIAVKSEEPLTTYLPISSSSSSGRKQTSSSRRPAYYSSTTPAVTTYSGTYSRGPTTPSYETPGTGVSKQGKGKVIVKFSDLHPLLLGKLGAECTCKADPFASFRGSKPLPINSSKGRIDLRNYDESDVYVDLDASKENGDYDSGEYNIYLESSTPANYDDGKYETPVIAVFDGVTPATTGTSKSRRPTSNYRSGSSSSTYLPPVSSTSRPSSSTYLSSASRGGVKASFSSNDGSVSASLTSARGGGFRAGKNLGGSSSATGNSLIGQGAAFDPFKRSGEQNSDETLEGVSDCARPGLFRHPNFCNKFYACHWDEWKKKFTLHVFNCPIHLTFDGSASACNWPSKGPACQDDNLLV